MRFAVIGGDARQATLSKLICMDGHDMKVFGVDAPPESLCVQQTGSLAHAVDGADGVILPIPVMRDAGMLNAPQLMRPLPISEILSAIAPSQILIGGRWTPEILENAWVMGIDTVDVLRREDFTVKNAIPTAEGALQIAMENTDHTMHGAECLVIGYGRIGKILASHLKALGAHVTVSTRKSEDLAWLHVAGIESVLANELEEELPRFSVVMNTAPSMILAERQLKKLDAHCLIIDLASSPGGVDFDAAHRLGLRCFWALGLPGKVAPLTAASILRDTVYSVMRERRRTT